MLLQPPGWPVLRRRIRAAEASIALHLAIAAALFLRANAARGPARPAPVRQTVVHVAHAASAYFPVRLASIRPGGREAAPTGGQSGAGGLRFDAKGVEFGPWVRSFTAQVRRNWIVPQGLSWIAAQVIVRFNVRKDGTITGVSVVGPSAVEALNSAASDALVVSSPTAPLPDEYPDDQASFTVTFHYSGQGF